MRLVFSRDRPAQLDLLLRSLERHAPFEKTRVMWAASDNWFGEGYLDLHLLSPPETDFNEDLRHELAVCADETVTFFCDDDIVYRDLPRSPVAALLEDDQILTVCLYLGRGNVKQRIPDGFPVWKWQPLARHDFGFPTAVDGNTFSVKDVLRLIGSDSIPNPTMLETVMALRAEEIAKERPLMMSFEDQCLVGVPVNRVSEQSGVPYGRLFPQATEALNERWLAGERIDLDALDFSGVNSCHHEIQFRWEERP